jgi:hypothetical protein
MVNAGPFEKQLLKVWNKTRQTFGMNTKIVNTYNLQAMKTARESAEQKGKEILNGLASLGFAPPKKGGKHRTRKSKRSRKARKTRRHH